MANLYEIRRANLRALIAQHGTGSVAKAAGYPSPSFLSQMTGPSAKKAVTESTARRIEHALGLETYWLDRERDSYGREIFGLANPADPSKDLRIFGLANAADAAVPPRQEDPLPVSADNTIMDADLFLECAHLLSNAQAEANVSLPKVKFAQIVKILMQAGVSPEGRRELAKNLINLAG